jgi:hypothetical protein
LADQLRTAQAKERTSLGAAHLLIFPPVQLPSGCQFVQPAVKANAVMAADHPSALLALPPFRLLPEELRNAVLLNGFEILDHAHPEQGLIARVEALQPFAGKTAAFMAVLDFAVQ